MLWSWLCDGMSHLLFLFLLHSCVFSFTLGWPFLWFVFVCGYTWYLPVFVSANLFMLSFFVASVHLCMHVCWRCSYVRPTRHYTVFLCEDSSGDELSQDDDSIAAFPEHFLLSAPFEWSLFKWFSSLISLMSISLKVNIWWLFYILCPQKEFGHTKKCKDVTALGYKISNQVLND